MVRILGQEDRIHIVIKEKRVIGVKEWNYLVKTCESYFLENKKPLVVELSDGARVSPVVRRAFSLFQSRYNSPIVLIA